MDSNHFISDCVPSARIHSVHSFVHVRCRRRLAVSRFRRSDQPLRVSVAFMAILEVETFTLNTGVEAPTFRALDEQMQEWCYVNRPGLARRTTARKDDGSYVVITLFGDATQSDAKYYTNSNALVASWSAAINESSRSLAVYSLL
jgi:hypothetical protein